MRLVRPPERPEGERLLDEGHDLGFQQFAGRGRWLVLGGWQTGGFGCRGMMCQAANWLEVGCSQVYGRSNGRYTDKADARKAARRSPA